MEWCPSFSSSRCHCVPGRIQSDTRPSVCQCPVVFETVLFCRCQSSVHVAPWHAPTPPSPAVLNSANQTINNELVSVTKLYTAAPKLLPSSCCKFISYLLNLDTVLVRSAGWTIHISWPCVWILTRMAQIVTAAHRDLWSCRYRPTNEPWLHTKN